MLSEANLIGRVGKKETKPMKNGDNVTAISLATSVYYKTPDGEKRQRTTWHLVNCFGKLSDHIGPYIEVGGLIYVKGEIIYQEIKSGERAGQYHYSIKAKEIKFLSKAKKEELVSKATGPYTTIDDYQDDIPF